VDFGAAASDSDGDGLPDAWELLHFTNLSRSGNSPAAGGQTALQAFTAGSDPNNPNGAFRLNISESNGQRVVSFVARRAEGVGYEGMTRYYALESNLDPGGTLWPALAAYEQITGNNQTVTYQAPGRTQVQFYRGKVWLASSGGGAGDTDTDGLPDVWETQFFGNLTRGAGTPVANGQTALQSYTSGTNPNDPNSVFKVSLSLIGNQQAVAFLARMAEGTGYEGRTRLYTLQSADRLDGIWQSVPGQSGIVGANQTVTYQTILSAGPQFYRAQVSLSP
jgi:hypothetical protein